MSDRQQALKERYRGRATERIRKLLGWLGNIDDGKGTEVLLRDIARELHTLKGDSSVVGLVAVSEVAHLCEEILLRFHIVDDLTPMTGTLRGALQAVDTAIRSDLRPESDAQQSLTDVRDMLQATVPELQDRASAPARLQAPTDAVAQVTVAQVTDGTAALTKAPTAGLESPVADESGSTRLAREAPRLLGQDRWLQIRASHVDALCEQVMTFVGEFRALHSGLRGVAERQLGAAAAGERLDAAQTTLLENADRCAAKLDDLASAAWSLLLVPVAPALEELGPYARELAQRQSKRVRVVVRAQDAALERGILEDLCEALLHLIRNAVDHGIEPVDARGSKAAEGTIVLEARQAAPNVVLAIADDGRGIDVPAVRQAAVERLKMSPQAAEKLPEQDVYHLLFAPGFSTRQTTSEVSGRGIGLDVVRERVDALGGRVSVSSTQGQGTRFELVVPATIGKERALVTACGASLYALPNAQTVEVVALRDHPVEASDGRRFIRYRGEPIPLRPLASVLREPESAAPCERAVVMQGNHHRWAFGIPDLVGEFDLIRRPVDALVSRFGHIAASATLDDGRLVLVLGVNGLIRLAELGTVTRAQSGRVRTKRMVLVVDDSPVVADVVTEILSDAGYEIVRASTGQEALAIIEESAPDLVLSDVEMPIMGGFELLERVRGRWPNLPVIMLTTRGGSDDRRRASALGANAYLVKSSFEETLLVDAVRRFLPAEHY